MLPYSSMTCNPWQGLYGLTRHVADAAHVLFLYIFFVHVACGRWYVAFFVFIYIYGHVTRGRGYMAL